METVRYRRDLYKLLPPNARCAELGVAEGYFAADMLSWGIFLYLVDRWECVPSMKGDSANDQEWHTKNYEDCLKRIEKFEGKYEILRGPTVRMAQFVEDNSLDLVNVDADHSYDGVKSDAYAWWPKLVSGGIMSFHDYEMRHYGVNDAVNEFARVHGLKVNLLPEDAIQDAGAYLIKP